MPYTYVVLGKQGCEMLSLPKWDVTAGLKWEGAKSDI